ncbi:hypothetical protein [Helicobacter sp.]|uniref:hypothetical protein n=1 Tax=Helicobacter sp. TaxID=218 RepID=UPI0025BFFC0A|nr:hypothetical protein [Helicobacter sp.]
MKVVFALLCGLYLWGGILAADEAYKNTHTAEPLLQGMKPDSHSEFAFEMGKSPLENINLLQYFGVILILVGLLLFLWYVKTRLNTPQVKCAQSSVLGALFDKKNLSSAVQVQSITTLGFHSKLVVFEAYGKRYLVIVSPNGAQLVDSYSLEIELQQNQAQESFKELLEQELPSETK